MKEEVIKIIVKYLLKDLEYQIGMCKTMESMEIPDDLPEPLKTKEKERYSKLKKDFKILSEFLNG